MSHRFSPPKDKADLLGRLVGDDSPFSEYRDVLFFAASVGWREDRCVPLTARGEAIRWEVMSNRLGAEEVMDMIAVDAHAEDRELLAVGRMDERISLLEQFANGGLEVIGDRLAASGVLPIRQVLIRMIQEYSRA